MFGNDGSDFFSHHDPVDVFRILERKQNDRDMIIHREAGRGAVHDHQVAREHLLIGNLVKFLRCRILRRVVGIDAVDVLGQQDGVGVDLGSAQDSAGVGGEEGIARAAAKMTTRPFSR